MPSITPWRNASLLNKIADFIEKHPEKLDHNFWCRVGGEVLYYACSAYNKAVNKTTDCDTAACIAGWAVLLADTKPEPGSSTSVQEHARYVLGLTSPEAVQLFHWSAQPVDGLTWPEALRKIAKGTTVAYCVHVLPEEQIHE